MTAQRLRMDVISDNIANVNTTRTEDGGAYRRKMPVFRAKANQPSFQEMLSSEIRKSSAGGVEVSRIAEDNSPLKRKYDPAHPDANENGFVELPNVNITTEMVDLIDASRAYQANVTAMDTAKNMALQAINIGK